MGDPQRTREKCRLHERKTAENKWERPRKGTRRCTGKHTSLTIINAWGKEDERTHGVTYNKVMSSIVGVV